MDTSDYFMLAIFLFNLGLGISIYRDVYSDKNLKKQPVKVKKETKK